MAYNAVRVAVSDESPTMWNFLTTRNTYGFHLEAVEFNENRRKKSASAAAAISQFVAVVMPVEIDEGGEACFDIKLEFKGIPHTHLHGEATPLPGSIHLVLEECCSFFDHLDSQDAATADSDHENKWMNIGLLSWYGKPRYVRNNTYVDFTGAGFFNPSYRAKKSRPVRLVAYYTVPFEGEDLTTLEPKKSVKDCSGQCPLPAI